MIENARYTADGAILATFNGAELSIPDDMANRHRRELAEWEAAGNVIQPLPAPTLADKKTAAIAALAQKRWQIETGGIVVGGAPIATDRGSQALINGAYQGALRHPSTVIDFKGVGGWVTLDAATMIAIGDAVFFHVQACFAREKILAEEVAAAVDRPALDAIDIDVGWPG